MSQLSRLLLPLDTLAGWPLALSATPLNYLLLFIGIPLVAAVVIAAAVKVSSSRHQQPSDTDYADPVWAGPEPTGGTPGHEQQQPRTLEQDGAAARSGRKGRGGASARW